MYIIHVSIIFYVYMSFVLLVDVESKRIRGSTRILDIWKMEYDFIIVNFDNYG